MKWVVLYDGRVIRRGRNPVTVNASSEEQALYRALQIYPNGGRVSVREAREIVKRRNLVKLARRTRGNRRD